MAEEVTAMDEPEFLMNMLVGTAVCKRCPHYGWSRASAKEYDTKENAEAAIEPQKQSSVV